MSVLTKARLHEGLIPLRRVLFVVLYDEDAGWSPQRMRLAGSGARRVPWGVRCGGAQDCRFDTRTPTSDRNRVRSVGELHSERAGIGCQREEMEQERRNIAAQRHRDPVIARAIGAVGLTLACLLPLLLAAYVIHCAVGTNRCGTAFRKTKI